MVQIWRCYLYRSSLIVYATSIKIYSQYYLYLILECIIIPTLFFVDGIVALGIYCIHYIWNYQWYLESGAA